MSYAPESHTFEISSFYGLSVKVTGAILCDQDDEWFEIDTIFATSDLTESTNLLALFSMTYSYRELARQIKAVKENWIVDRNCLAEELAEHCYNLAKESEQ